MSVSGVSFRFALVGVEHLKGQQRRGQDTHEDGPDLGSLDTYRTSYLSNAGILACRTGNLGPPTPSFLFLSIVSFTPFPCSFYIQAINTPGGE